MFIEIQDFKGDFWQLGTKATQVTVNKQGLWEIWLIVFSGPLEITKDFPVIPIPIFTTWWEDHNCIPVLNESNKVECLHCKKEMS